MSVGIRRRCAIYTRKSSDEGLEQDFNSLHAQREACEAFIVSQKHEGWGAVSAGYDDGGFSGGSLSRPALERLLDDVKGGRIDVVVVYKVDRLTRSLTDFARIVEIFDAHGVSFVSVTQQFNTTSSMGRLTLNVLLSFAQFEREVTAERIRDKIAASKKKGMWMGGLPPLGYDVRDKHLVVNPAEAETVGELFRLYREIGSVRSLKEEIDQRGLLTKRRTLTDGAPVGGKPFSRGHLYALLSNPLYIGKVRHRGALYEGQHRPILDEETFQAVQERLAAQASPRHSQTNGRSLHLLTGLIYDETGDRMSPTHAVNHGRRYRYYVSHRLMEARRREQDGWRLPAVEIEQLVVDHMATLLGDSATLLDLSEWKAPLHQTKWGLQRAAEGADMLSTAKSDVIAPLLRTLLNRVEVCPDGIRLQMFADTVRRWLAGEAADSAVEPEGQEPCVIWIQATLQRRGVEARLVLSHGCSKGKSPNANLTAVVAKAHRCLSLLTKGGLASMEEVAKVVSLPASEVSRILPLAFLAPDIVQAILSGKQPITLTAKRLKRLPALPQDWAEQRQLLGFV
jgi:site-specific DNA recombinase